MPQPLIILGASARAAAQSARRAGYDPWTIDLFVDRDLQAIAAARRCPPAQYPAAMLALLDHGPHDAPVLLTGAMENYPQTLEAIAFAHPMLGASPAAIRQARDPLALPSLPKTKGLRFCDTRTASYLHRLRQLIFGAFTRTKYLLKPRRSAGGSGIEWWSPGTRIDEDHYIQQYVPGIAYSAVFVGDGWSSALVGVTEQLIGEAEFGCQGKAGAFRYCGSIGPVKLSEQKREALRHLGVQIAQRHDVRGPFGVDLIMDWRGRLWPVEINPRYVASIEILERALDIAVLSPDPKKRARADLDTAHMHGKAVVFARKTGRVGDLYEHLDEREVADVPEMARLVRAGRPICTVLAHAGTRDACHKQLVDLARQVYAVVEPAGETAGEAAANGG
ncbi:MAG: ATP-grasp domain-containing protein [Phycisphaeraceae bacterium]